MFVCVCFLSPCSLQQSSSESSFETQRERDQRNNASFYFRQLVFFILFSVTFVAQQCARTLSQLSLSFTSGNIAHFVSFRFIALFVLLLFCCCLNNNFLNNTFRLHYFKLSYSFLFCFVCGSCCCWGLLSLFLTLLCAVFVCGNDFLFSQCVARCLCECCFTVCYTEIKRVLSLCFCCLVTSSSAFVCLLHM